MGHRIYISKNEDIDTVRDALAWSGLKPEEIAEALEALERINFHKLRALSLLDESYKWLTAPARLPLDEYGDFMHRYKSFKEEEQRQQI